MTRLRYFVSMYTDGPATRWNVVDRQTQEWVRRFPTEAEAQDYADVSNWAGRETMSVAVPNDPAANEEIADRMLRLRAKATQQPISYKTCFDEAMSLADDLFHRAMCAEAEIARLRSAWREFNDRRISG